MKVSGSIKKEIVKVYQGGKTVYIILTDPFYVYPRTNALVYALRPDGKIYLWSAEGCDSDKVL